MRLSTVDSALAEAAYQRLQKRSYGRGAGIGAVVAVSINLPSFAHSLEDPQTSHRYIAVLAALFGLILGSCITYSNVSSSRRKEDEELVRFFEKHFPEECSWKQEEKILAEAKDLELKARVDNLIQRQT